MTLNLIKYLIYSIRVSKTCLLNFISTITLVLDLKTCSLYYYNSICTSYSLYEISLASFCLVNSYFSFKTQSIYYLLRKTFSDPSTLTELGAFPMFLSTFCIPLSSTDHARCHCLSTYPLNERSFRTQNVSFISALTALAGYP